MNESEKPERKPWHRLTLEEKCARMRERMLAQRGSARRSKSVEQCLEEERPQALQTLSTPAAAPEVIRRNVRREKRETAPAPPAKVAFQWNRSHTLSLANPRCSYCHGIGLTFGRTDFVPCKCVLRSVFRACLGKYRYIQANAAYISKVSLDRMDQRYRSPGSQRLTYGRKHQEFAADFILVAKRTLSADEWKLFEMHMLEDRDWRHCTLRLNMDRGSFFHAVYNIQARLGRVFRELQPYALYPLDEYFGSVRTMRDTAAVPIRTEASTPGATRHGSVEQVRIWPEAPLPIEEEQQEWRMAA